VNDLPARGRCAAADVQYHDDATATGALVVCSGPSFAELVEERRLEVPEVAPYVPGAFYLRELPVLAALLEQVEPVDLLVVDGYVDLDAAGSPGLGAHAHARFRVPVVGVAKTAFHGATHAVPVVRGSARRPLYVTAAGLPLDDAAALVQAMAGTFRLPDALRRVDALARGRT
jgi:deoxyribonuclease V